MGGGGGGGLTDFHRQNRKRELHKLKEQRLAARDAKVKETKTVASVQEEIRHIERQNKNKEVRPHAIQSKLDRLNKELKIVQAEEENAKKQAAQSTTTPLLHPAAKKSESVWKPLECPALSVYYDPVLNPFGEPPPGKPRMFHTRFGGTTMNIDEAGLPGQPPPPPTTNHLTESTVQNPAKNYIPSHHCDGGFVSQRSDDRSLDQKKERAPATRKTMAPTKKAPNQPVIAAQRPKRYGKQAVDVWASNDDEMDHHGRGPQDEDPLVAAADPSQKHNETKTKEDKSHAIVASLPSEQWYYQDQAGQVQGPYSTDHMQQWIAAGFFPAHQLIQCSRTGAWNPLQEIPGLRNSLPWMISIQTAPTANDDESVPESLQDRIAALRESTKSGNDQGLNSDDDDPPELSVQDRIAALKRAYVADSAAPLDDAPDSVEAPSAVHEAESQNTNDHPRAFENSIASDTRDRTIGGDVDEAPKPTTKPVEGPGRGMLDILYPIGEADMADIPYPVPGEADMADIPYPVPDEGHGYMADVAYPAVYDESGDGHEIGYEGAQDDYPVVDSFPVVERYPGANDDYDDKDGALQEEVKRAKKVDVDKEVVSLLPSHLRKKRRQA